jgi:hypothetical protein
MRNAYKIVFRKPEEAEDLKNETMGGNIQMHLKVIEYKI